MGISNSFHSSGKGSAIRSSGGLGKVQAHNEREYFAKHLSADKINYIFGGPGIAEQVKNFLNEQFQPAIDEYNAQQKRRDRRITDTPFEYFCKNKTMDIAAEEVFQLGDMEYWSRWRTDTIIGKTKKGKDIVIHDFPDEIAAIMDEIYRQQAIAYENIYSTDGDKILEKIETHYRSCEQILEAAKAANPEQFEKFVAIAKVKPEPRKKKIAALTAEEKEAYAAFAEAYFGKEGIDEKHLIERIKEGKMHIKLLQLVGHHDEWSLHAQGVSVCWTEGHYDKSINARVAKSTVLNRYALEVLQDKMREIAEREMAKYPEIFAGTELNEKGVGRNIDWSKEEVIRRNQEKLLARHEKLADEIATQTATLDEIEQKIELGHQLAEDDKRMAAAAQELLKKDVDAMRKLKNEYRELCPIKSLKHYQGFVLSTDEKLRELNQLVENVAEETYYQGGNEEHAARMLEVIFRSIAGIIEDIRARIAQTKFYEIICRVFDGLTLQKNGEWQERALNNILSNAYNRADSIDEGRSEITQNPKKNRKPNQGAADGMSEEYY